MRRCKFTQRAAVGICMFAMAAVGITAQENIIGFDSDQWVKTNATIVEFKGRPSLMGQAFLKDVAFTNGVIEVDLYIRSGRRSYPGLIFRIQPPGNYERFYVRPHRSIFYPDALQYTGVINGIAEWQICHGPGCTDFATIPTDGWISLKIEVMGSQAKVYLSDSEQPVLHIHELRHGVSTGTIGVEGPADGSAYFSNFRFRQDDTLAFDPPPHSDSPPGMIKAWELSQVFKLSQLDFESYPLSQEMGDITWQNVEAEKSGLVDIARYYGRTGREPDCILARATIEAVKNETRKLKIGYSDFISIFLNGDLLFSGNSSYRFRDLSFLGIVGLFDTVYLPLEEGENELLLVVAESYGGWGFMCQDGTAEFIHPELEREWATEKQFKIPESAAYDALHEVIYVSNYDGYNIGQTEGQAISKVSLDGKIIEEEWIKGIVNPTGMAVFEGRLYVVERSHLAVIDTKSGEIVSRHAVPDPGFLNDIAVDGDGTVFISDSSKHVIYRFQGEKVEVWFHGPEIRNPNGLLALEDRVVFGNNGDITLKAVLRDTKNIENIVRFKSGIIDGIQSGPDKGFLVSLNEGKLFLVTTSGNVVKLLDTTAEGVFCADFVYAPEKNTLVIPTFLDNRVMKYIYKADTE